MLRFTSGQIFIIDTLSSPQYTRSCPSQDLAYTPASKQGLHFHQLCGLLSVDICP
jgi:hypothetical protein